MRAVKALVFSFFILSSTIYAQNYEGWESIVHTENKYTPAESALFNMPSYVNPSLYAHTYNPSLAGLVQGSGFELSDYLESDHGDTRVQTFSANLKIDSKNAISVSYYRYHIDEHKAFFDSDYEFLTLSASYSRNIFNNVNVGIGVNNMRSTALGLSNVEMFTVDIGGVFNQQFQTWSYIKSNFVAIASINNLFGTVNEELRVSETKLSDAMQLYPVFLDIGIANQFILDKTWLGENLFALNLQVNYTNSLNDGKFEYIRLGAEFRFLAMLYLRVGHIEFLTQQLNDTLGKVNPDTEAYGIGLDIPVHKIYNPGFDLNLIFNFGQSYEARISGKSDKFNSYSLGVMIN